MAPTVSPVDSPARRAWAVTLGLVALAGAAVLTVVATGGSATGAVLAVVALGGLAVQTARSGGRFTFEAGAARPVGATELPAVRGTLLALCADADRPVPRLLVMEMDVPGAVVGYVDGEATVAVDPRLPRVVGREGVRALLAHELGHLRTDLHSDALRAYVPQTVGFATFWLVALAGRGETVAGVGTAAFVGLALVDALAPGGARSVRLLRYALGLGVEPLVLAASRYANRLEEYGADAYAGALVGPEQLAEALYRLAAVATGENDEDVAGPIPWRADRSVPFALFATHPAVEDRVARLGCAIPDWVVRGRRDP